MNCRIIERYVLTTLIVVAFFGGIELEKRALAPKPIPSDVVCYGAPKQIPHPADPFKPKAPKK